MIRYRPKVPQLTLYCAAHRNLLIGDGITTSMVPLPLLTQACVRCNKSCSPFRTEVPDAMRINGRGLCGICHQWAAYRDCLADYPRKTMTRDDLLEEYELLRSAGCTWRDAAAALGMKYTSFERAMYRARRKGDPRAKLDHERAMA